MASGVITAVGLTAMLQAQISSTAFQPNVVKISSDVLACTGAEISLSNIVCNVPSVDITQIALHSNTVRTIVHLDTTIGTFTIGTIGLFTSGGVLFALAAFPGAGSKVADNPPTVIGNIRTFYIDTVYEDISNIFAVELTSISSISVYAALTTLTGTITARQLRTALANASQLNIVTSAILSTSSTNQAVIDWHTCASVVPAGALITFIASTLSLLDGGAALLAAAALLPA